MTPKNSTKVKITYLKNWANNLVCIRTFRPKGYFFKPGQFARISATRVTSVSLNAKLIWRAQSITSCPMDEFLEFLIILGDEGDFSNECNCLSLKDSLFLDNQNYGYLTLDRFPRSGDLWLFASGSGIAPFISIIKSFRDLEEFNRINIVHSLKEGKDFTNYLEFLNFDFFLRGSKLIKKFTYLPIVTRENVQLHGLVNGEKIRYKSPMKRFTLLLKNGELENMIKCKLSLSESKIMICGNPGMIKDTRSLLKSFGFTSSRKNQPGQIAVENFW